MNRRGISVSVATWLAVLAAVCGLVGAPAMAQNSPRSGPEDGDGIQLDFNDVELAVVIDTIARLTGRNFIYDDRVRGRVTIVSPTRVTTEQAYAVFESVLQVKGFTTVDGPGGVLKIIPIRDAKESSIETVKDNRPSPNRDLFVTRLIPLEYIDAEAITNTVKPLVSKDASMVAYPPTNTIILTDTSANIRRLLSILDAIDVETYKEELAVLKIHHADAAVLGQQISDIFGAEVSSSAATTTRRTRATTRRASTTDATVQSSQRSNVRLITDDRTNSLLVLASRGQLEEIRGLVRKLDIPVTGGGSIRVYYLKHADSEELAATLNGLVSGTGAAASAGRTGAVSSATQAALRSAVTELADGVTLTADPATNSIVIQGSKEAYDTLADVINLLDIERPQVLVEALIMEVDITDGKELGFNAAMRLIGDNYDITTATVTDAATAGLIGSTGGAAAALPFLANAVSDTTDGGENKGTLIQGTISAAQGDDNINIVSAPHILTSDNEEAEIRIGNNIPIITSRVQSASGVATGGDDLATAVNVERQDIGVTLRVTPQISEGNTLRLRIFQELTAVNETLSQDTGDPSEVGVALTSRRIENTVVVQDGQTVVIGGLIGEVDENIENKVPFLGDIPVLGWLFKSIRTRTRKENLLVFLTPHIIRSAADLEFATVRKREQFELESDKDLTWEDVKDRKYKRDPVRRALVSSEQQSPLERMREIEDEKNVRLNERIEQERLAAARPPRFNLRAGVFRDADEASAQLTELLDAGYDGNLVSGETAGVVLIEIVVGPFQTLDEAESTASILQQAYGLSSDVVVSSGDGQ